MSISQISNPLAGSALLPINVSSILINGKPLVVANANAYLLRVGQAFTGNTATLAKTVIGSFIWDGTISLGPILSNLVAFDVSGSGNGILTVEAAGGGDVYFNQTKPAETQLFSSLTPGPALLPTTNTVIDITLTVSGGTATQYRFRGLEFRLGIV